MKMDQSWWNNFIIYYNNLSTCYLCCIVVSFLAVFITWLTCDFRCNTSDKVPSSSPTQEALLQDDADDKNGVSDDSVDTSEHNDDILTRIKLARQKAIEEELKSNLTQEQLEEEKQTEQKQLEAIFKLLREQEDKFQVNSMEELQDQLRLYRR